LLNIRPAIAIEQKNPVRTARSTVGTSTEIADLLRLLFAKIGRPTCPTCNQLARGYQPGDVVTELLSRFPGGRGMVLFPVATADRGDDRSLVQALLTGGFIRLKCGTDIIDLEHGMTLPSYRDRELYVVVDRLILTEDNRSRVLEAVETALTQGHGQCRVDIVGQESAAYSTRFMCQVCGRVGGIQHPFHVPGVRSRIRAHPADYAVVQSSTWRLSRMQGVRQHSPVR
jgi:excinuclease ABC subunit A